MRVVISSWKNMNALANVGGVSFTRIHYFIVLLYIIYLLKIILFFQMILLKWLKHNNTGIKEPASLIFISISSELFRKAVQLSCSAKNAVHLTFIAT